MSPALPGRPSPQRQKFAARIDGKHGDRRRCPLRQQSNEPTVNNCIVAVRGWRQSDPVSRSTNVLTVLKSRLETGPDAAGASVVVEVILSTGPDV
jgi:hypothetical protein